MNENTDQEKSRNNVVSEAQKIVRKGKCIRCGKCCKQVVLRMPYEPALEDYLKWLALRRDMTVRRSTATGRVEIEIKAKCRFLKFRRGKMTCSVYATRPKICRDFPLNFAAAMACPGFNFVPEEPARPACLPQEDRRCDGERVSGDGAVSNGRNTYSGDSGDGS